jgi:hypothetical protein
MPEEASYFERQWLHRSHIWLWLLILPAIGLVWYLFVMQIAFHRPPGNHPATDTEMWIAWLFVGIGIPVLLLSAHLTSRVTPDGIRIAYFPFLRRRFRFTELASCSPCTYRPFQDYGGWGIRWNPRLGWIYNVYGNQGVRLTFCDGRQLILGSQRPEELALAVSAGMSGTRAAAGPARGQS